MTIPDSPADSEPVWTSPAESSLYVHVRQQVDDLGLDARAFDELMYSVGALASLHAHGPVLASLARLLDAPIFETAAHWAPHHWPDRLPAWRDFLADVPQLRARLLETVPDSRFEPKVQPAVRKRRRRAAEVSAREAELESIVPKHPMRRHGLIVAPVPSFLVVGHEFADSAVSDQIDVARRFAHMQSMLAALCIHLTWRSGRTVEDFLVHNSQGRHEFPGRPIHFDPACRAARWLSEAPQAEYARTLPLATDPCRYAAEIDAWADRLTHALGEAGATAQARTHLKALASLFSYWPASILPNFNPLPRTRRSSDGGGEGSGAPGVDGYVDIDLNLPPAADGDDALGSGLPPGGQYGPTKGGPNFPRLPLVDGSQIRSALSSQKWAEMRKAAAAVVLPFDLNGLSPDEAGALAHRALSNLQGAIPRAAPLAPVIALLSLAFGQTPEVCAQLRVAGIAKGTQRAGPGSRALRTLDEALQQAISHPVLLVEGQPQRFRSPWRRGNAEEPILIGFLLPALAPQLVDGEDTSAPAGAAGRSVRNLLLPAGQAGSWAFKLYRHAAGHAPPASMQSDGWCVPAFDDWLHLHGWSASGAEGELLRFLNEEAPPLGHKQWTASLLQRHLPRTIEAISGDKTLAWMATAQPSRSGEARVYYTQHRTETLVQAWTFGMDRGGLGALKLADPSPDRQSAATLWPASWQPREGVHDVAVGAPFVPTVCDVQRLIQTLQTLLAEPFSLSRTSALRSHHRNLLLYTIVLQGLCMAPRAVRSPVALARALEQHDRVQLRAKLGPDDMQVFVGLADKESYYDQNARLGRLPPMLVRQLRVLHHHQSQLMVSLDRVAQWRQSSPRVRAMFRLDEEDNPVEISTAWVEQQLAQLGFPWPANFARGFVRTRLLERGCPASDLDALLGHRDPGGGAIGLHATLDFSISRNRIEEAMQALHRELALTCMDSQLVPRLPPVPDPEVLLAPLHRAGPLGRGRSLQARKQPKPEGWSLFWQAIHQRATDDDRKQVALLLRLLGRMASRGNAFAAVLTAHDPVAAARTRHVRLVGRRESAEVEEQAAKVCDLAIAAGVRGVIETLVRLAENGTRRRFGPAASWLRLLLRARRKLEQQGIDTPSTPLVAFVRAPTSPFMEESVLVLPVVDGWRHALRLWMGEAFARSAHWTGNRHKARPDGKPDTNAHRHAAWPEDESALPPAPSPFAAEGWAAALVMSAALNGMLLDVGKLSMLLRRFCAPGGRDLPLATGARRAHLDLRLPANGSVDRQLHRWWFDPLTELIWLHAPPMSRDLTLADLFPWLRRLALRAFDGSVSTPFEPQSFSDLVRCSEVWWLARSSRSAVAHARRQVDSSAVLSARWGAIAGASRLVAPHALSAFGDGLRAASVGEPDSSSPLTPYERLAMVDYDGSRRPDVMEASDLGEGDEDMVASLSTALPWIGDVAALLQVAATAGKTDLGEAALLACLPADADQTERQLASFAAWLAAPEGAALTGPTLVRSFTAAAQVALLTETGDPDQPLDEGRLDRLLDAVTDMPLAAGATSKSLHEAVWRLARFVGCESELRSKRPDRTGEDEPYKKQADARVLTHEEYEAILDALTTDADAIEAKHVAHARMLLMLCFRLGCRPSEVYSLRLKDITARYLHVLPYGSHTLKSDNAKRRVPLYGLMTAGEREELKALMASRRADGAQADDLLFADGEGPIKRSRLDAVLRRVMRRVTLDPAIRIYHARHSLATWLDLALRAKEQPALLRLVEHLPKTHAWLQTGPTLARALFGSEAAALGRTSYAIARLLGHIGPAITVMHYQHGADLICAATVERETAAISKDEWMRILGLGRTTVFGLFANTDGYEQLLMRMREQLGWSTAPVSLVRSDGRLTDKGDVKRLTKFDKLNPAATQSESDAGMLSPKAGWDLLVRVLEMTQPVAKGSSTVEDQARLRGLNPDAILDMLDHLKRWLPRVAQPGATATKEAQEGKAALAVADDVKLMLGRMAGWVLARSREDSVGLERDVEFLVSCYDRRDRDFHVKNAEGLKRLVELMQAMGFAAESVRVVLRSAEPGAWPHRLPDWVPAGALGPFEASQRDAIKVRSLAKADSYAKWVGLAPHGSGREGCGFAVAVGVCVALCVARSLGQGGRMPPGRNRPEA